MAPRPPPSPPVSPIGPIPTFLRVLRWKYSGWAIGVSLPLGVGLVLNDKFAFAYFCFAIAMPLSIGAWVLSDELEKRRPRQRRATKRNPNPRPIRKADISNYRRWRILPVAGILIFFLILLVWTRSLQVEKELPLWAVGYIQQMIQRQQIRA